MRPVLIRGVRSCARARAFADRGLASDFDDGRTTLHWQRAFGSEPRAGVRMVMAVDHDDLPGVFEDDVAAAAAWPGVQLILRVFADVADPARYALEHAGAFDGEITLDDVLTQCARRGAYFETLWSDDAPSARLLARLPAEVAVSATEPIGVELAARLRG